MNLAPYMPEPARSCRGVTFFAISFTASIFRQSVIMLASARRRLKLAVHDDA
jgi:hypothetical protein